MSNAPYYVELTQEDPPDSPTPGSWHYAGEISGFTTATKALEAGLLHIGEPVPEQYFYPCCDFQQRDTIITAVVVYWEDASGNRNEEWSITASLKSTTQAQKGA